MEILSVKRIHDDFGHTVNFKLLLKYFRNDISNEDEINLFVPILYRTVNLSHPDHENINFVSRNRQLISIMNDEFSNKFNKYKINRIKIMLLKKIQIKKMLPYDIYIYICRFI